MGRHNLLLWYRFQSVTTRGYFDEAVEDEEEFREMGGNSSASDIFLTLATDFRTEAPALEHLFLNSARPNFVIVGSFKNASMKEEQITLKAAACFGSKLNCIKIEFQF